MQARLVKEIASVMFTRHRSARSALIEFTPAADARGSAVHEHARHRSPASTSTLASEERRSQDVYKWCGCVDDYEYRASTPSNVHCEKWVIYPDDGPQRGVELARITIPARDNDKASHSQNQ